MTTIIMQNLKNYFLLTFYFLLTLLLIVMFNFPVIAEDNQSKNIENYPITTNKEIADSSAAKKIAKSTIINGTVLDENTKKPIPSATVRIEGSNKGTICSKDGTFRLPKGNFTNKSNIKITSVGYHSKTVTLDLTKDTVTIFLKQNPVALKEAVVIGEIDVNEIIRRAIRKKDENRRKYNTMQGLLYSKFTMDFSKITANILKMNNSNSQINVGIGIGTNSSKESEQKANDTVMAKLLEGFIGETFSQRFVDNEKNIDKTIIVNRRQTANIPKTINTIVLENFIDFSLDEINFIDTKIITPLHKNALSHYKFELIERKLFEDKFVYVIKVTPNTAVYPTFQGTISILEGTYQLIEANLKPSNDTKIHLIENLEYYEKFENIGNDIWFPTYMENRASLKVKLIPLIPPIELDWTTTAIFSDVIIDKPLPDSIYHTVDSTVAKMAENNDKTMTKITLVATDADSTKKEYWEDNALIALTEKEQELYNNIDSAIKESNIDIDSFYNTVNTTPQKKKFFWSYTPYIRYNRVESFVLGLLPTVEIPYTKINGEGLYSSGQHRWLGSAKFEIGTGFGNAANNTSGLKNIFSSTPYLSVKGEIFSKVNTFGNSFKDANLFINTLDVIFFHEDYFDYFRSDGWNTKLNFDYRLFSFSATYENRREFGLDKTTNKSLFSDKAFRENPHPETGKFQLIKLNSTFGNNIISLSENFQYKFDVNYQYGIREIDKSTFSQISGTASMQFPIFETGYGNILLLLSVAGGLAEHNSPVQHLFVIEESEFFSNLLTPEDNMFATAYATYFGGTEFFSYHARLNLRDWWWRLLHLPKIKGRGLELSLSMTVGKFFNKGNTELSNLYRSTEKDFYSEAGFRIGRIPIPGTDLIYWSLETRFGIGEYAKGRIGFLLNFNLLFGL